MPEGRYAARQIDRLTEKRNRKVKHYLPTASRRIFDHLVSEGIGTLVIGKNKNWKQESNIGQRHNQNFVSTPQAQFVDMLTYKAKLVGIKVSVTEENYTSKASFLDLEPVEKREGYVATRVKRGLFRAANGRLINADVNAAFQIIRKVAPDAFGNGVEDVAVHPSGLCL